MTDLNFSTGIRRLETAFGNSPLSEERLRLYYEKINSISDDEWLRTVERIIETEDRFPSIATIMKTSTCNGGTRIINGEEYRDGYKVLK